MKQRIAFYCLLVALAITLAGLAMAIHTLSTVKEERSRLLAWQARILSQLGSAMATNPAFDHTRPLPAADASEALADIIGARDDAVKLLALPRPDQIAPSPDSQAARNILPGKAVAPGNIPQLLNRHSSGAAGSDVEAIDHDSQSPWTGWQ